MLDCIHRKFFGGQEWVNFSIFASDVVQDEDEAERIANWLCENPGTAYPFNEGVEQEFYEEFFVPPANVDELRRQVRATELADELAENGMDDIASMLRERGPAHALELAKSEIAGLRQYPDSDQLTGNLELAVERLEGEL